MGIKKAWKKAKNKVKSAAKKYTNFAKDTIGNPLRPDKAIKNVIKWDIGEVADVLSPLAGMMAPDIDLGDDPTEDLKDSSVSATQSVDQERERAKRYAAYSTDNTTGKKRKLGSYGQGTELQKYMDRVKGGLIGGQS